MSASDLLLLTRAKYVEQLTLWTRSTARIVSLLMLVKGLMGTGS
jgi:hypothetical protein